VISDLEQDEFSCPERIAGLQGYGCDHGTDEAAPHGFIRKVVRKLLETEEHTSNGCPEGD
jgi:hypothetical protein